MLYAVACFTGETRYTAALNVPEQSAALLEILRADVVFPLAQHIRIASAVMLAASDRMPPQPALMALRRALDHDPLNPKLNFWMGVQLARSGDFQQAREYQARLNAPAPGWAQARRLADLIDRAEQAAKGQTR